MSEHNEIRRALCAELAQHILDVWRVEDPCHPAEEHLNDVMTDLATHIRDYAGKE